MGMSGWEKWSQRCHQAQLLGWFLGDGEVMWCCTEIIGCPHLCLRAEPREWLLRGTLPHSHPAVPSLGAGTVCPDNVRGDPQTYGLRESAASLSPVPCWSCQMNKSWAGRKQRDGLVNCRLAA